MKKIMRYLLPKNGTGDVLFIWGRFLIVHRRVPRNESGLINDRLYRMKVDGTLLDPLRQFISDKEYLKIYITGTVGNEYNVETFDVLRNMSDIDAYKASRFPCIVKPTHASGRVKVCFSQDDFPERELLKKWLRSTLYRKTREQNYKFLRPKIIVEEFISHDGVTVPDDYKIFCFHGVPKFIQVDFDRFTNHTRNFYDTEWRRLNVEWKYPNRPLDQARPEALDKMLRLASKLSAPFDFIRVDLYAIRKEVRVGEITNLPGNAHEKFKPKEMERKLYYWEES